MTYDSNNRWNIRSKLYIAIWTAGRQIDRDYRMAGNLIISHARARARDPFVDRRAIGEVEKNLPTTMVDLPTNENK